MSHINVAELDSVIKGMNTALKWGCKKLTVKTDSTTVFKWINSLLTKDHRIKSHGLSEILVQRRLSIIEEFHEKHFS